MRLLLRIVSFALLAAAVVLGVLDAVESVAGSGLALTSLQQVWARFSPATLSATAEAVGGLPFSAWLGKGLAWVLAEPASAVLLALALLAWMGGYRKIPAAGRFAA